MRMNKSFYKKVKIIMNPLEVLRFMGNVISLGINA